MVMSSHGSTSLVFINHLNDRISRLRLIPKGTQLFLTRAIPSINFVGGGGGGEHTIKSGYTFAKNYQIYKGT